MPYIKKELRDKIDHEIDNLITSTLDIGENDIDGVYNYIITRLIDTRYRNGYRSFNRAMGVLDCVAREFYRRQVAPYEDKKRDENGEVYTL